MTGASLLCALAGDITFLNTARAVQGIGAAIMFAVARAAGERVPGTGERIGALAAYGATIGASFAVGPLVGGALTSGLGWRWIFLLNLPLGLAGLAITRTRVAESRDALARRVDLAGLLTLSGGLFLLILALLRGNEAGWSSATILAAALAAPPRCWAPSWPSSCASPSPCCRSGCSATARSPAPRRGRSRSRRPSSPCSCT